jgi:hypothetical protein
VNHVVAGADVLSKAREIADAIARMRTKGIMTAMHVPYRLGLAEGKAMELERYMEIYDLKTFVAAVTALFERRTIEFTDWDRKSISGQGERVKTKTIQQTVRFKASPGEVYGLLMNSKKHRSLSWEKAVISARVPGRFTAWNGHITGFNLALLPGTKIVQASRATGWWPDHYSIAIFDIEKVKGGAVLRFTQIGVPSHRYSGHYRGWIEAYWTPMKEVLASGKISHKTRARVEADREKRISTQHFRRKISGVA